MAATALGALLAWYAYSTGPEKVLWATGAEEVLEPATDQQRQLVNVVEEMAIAAGVPRPRIWIVPDPDPNAFATGVDPSHAHVAVTQGLLDLCSRDELQAVIGHELGHVKNLDVRLMTTLAALVGAALLMRDGATRIFFSRGSGRIAGGGGGGGGGGRGGRKNLGPLVDRKSTRLNSSHANISYAVFCLKKKKKKNKTNNKIRQEYETHVWITLE